MGYNPLTIKDEQYTAPSVVAELRPETTPHIRLKSALETGKLKIHTPSPNTLKNVEAAARKTGDTTTLSKTDKEVLAVALELSQNNLLSPTLISDDYALQNVADLLKLKYTPLETHGIRHRFKWTLYCPACKQKYPPNTSQKICGTCGTPLKRKVQKKYPKEKRTDPTATH